MSHLETRVVRFASRISDGLRSLWPLGRSQGRLQASTRQAELEGLQFAFYARLIAIIIVSVWLVWLVP
jgi:adenylate cyclase